MKLSTMLFIAAFLLYIGTLAAHNFSLKATYLSGNHKNRFNEHHFKALSGVRELQVKTGNVLSIIVEYGLKEGVWLSDRIKDDIKITQSGETVIIDAVMSEKDEEFANGPGDIVFVLKDLDKLRTYNDPANSRVGSLYMKNLKVKDFAVLLDDHFVLTIDSCEFGSLSAVVGTVGRNSRLEITNENKIGTAAFDIRGGNYLELYNSDISKLSYKLCDSSKVFITGKMLKAINNRL